MRQQRYKCDDAQPEFGYLEALGRHFLHLLRLREADPFHWFLFNSQTLDGRKKQSSASDLVIQYIPPKKANCFKDIRLYFQFCTEAVQHTGLC